MIYTQIQKSRFLQVSIDDIRLEEDEVTLTTGLQRTEERDGFKVNVFCTDLQLTRLPLSLPPDTVYLNLENNQVCFRLNLH